MQIVKLDRQLYFVGAYALIFDNEEDVLDMTQKGALCLIHYLRNLMRAYKRAFSLEFRLKGYFEAFIFKSMEDIIELDILCMAFEEWEEKLRSLSIEQIAEIESKNSKTKAVNSFRNHLETL